MTINCITIIGGELYESVGVEAPILLSYTHKNEWITHGGLPTRCQRSAMGVSLILWVYDNKMGASTPTLSYNSPPMITIIVIQLCLILLNFLFS